MRIEIEPGDELLVTLKDTDGEFRILYDVGGDQKLRVLCDMPDGKGRGGDPGLDQLVTNGKKHDPEIYCEDFGAPLRDEDGSLLISDVEEESVGLGEPA